jgi:hypothetical protein
MLFGMKKRRQTTKAKIREFHGSNAGLNTRSKSRHAKTSAIRGKMRVDFGIVSRNRHPPDLCGVRIGTGANGVDMPRKLALVKRLALDGYSDEVMARIAGVTPEIWDYWKAVHPEFQDAIDTGRTSADAEVIATLFELATGYTRTVTEVHGKDAERVCYSKYFPPDRSAIKDWLSMRPNKNFRAQPQAIDVTTKGKAINGLKQETKSELIASIVKLIRPQPDQQPKKKAK